jgi:hypothetical protein
MKGFARFGIRITITYLDQFEPKKGTRDQSNRYRIFMTFLAAAARGAATPKPQKDYGFSNARLFLR